MAVEPGGLISGGRLARDVVRDYLLEFGMVAVRKDELLRLRDLMKIEAPSEWKRWQEVIMAVPHVGSDWPPVDELTADGLVCRGDAATLYAAGDDLANAWLSELDANLDDGCAMASEDVEATRLDSLQRSALLEIRRRWRQEELPAHTSRDVVWERLRPLVVASKRLVVVDPFSVKCAAGCLESTPKASGVEWLLTKIGEVRSPIAVTILGHIPEPPFDALDQIEALAEHLWDAAQGRLIELEVAASDEGRFRQVAHDRTLRFVSPRLGRVVSLGDSLDAFSGDSTRRALVMGCQVQTAADAERSRKMEERLMKIAQQSGVVIRRSSGA